MDRNGKRALATTARPWRRALLLCAGSTAALSTPALAATTGDAQSSTEEIVVTAPPFLREVPPERRLDAQDVEAYGVSTISEFLAELQGELGDGADDAPLIFVNGDRVNSLDEIGGLPVEALRNVNVLPRGSATKAGGKTGQRVISLTLKPLVRSATLTAARKIATDGDWHSDRGEAILTQVRQETRFNLTLRGRHDTALYESDRDIIQRPTTSPFAQAGNIVPFPSSATEIDPALSALAGFPVTVVPLPQGADPTLAQLVPVANQAALTDLGRFRTIRPDTDNYDVSGSAATKLASWLRGTAALRFGRTTSDFERGLASGLFTVAPTNSFSPFSRTVAIALYGDRPLRSRSVSISKEANVNLDGNVGSWNGNLALRHRILDFRSSSERRDTAGTIAIADDVDPFTADLASLLILRRDSARSLQRNSAADFTMDGPLLTIPAGPIHATAEALAEWERLKSESTYSVGEDRRRFARDKQSLRGLVDVPLASRESFGRIGDLSVSAEYQVTHFSDVGTLDRYAFGSVWEPVPALRLHAELEREEEPAPLQTVGSPVVATPDVLTFDPLTGETVSVTQVTGGNPGLRPQTTVTRRAGALVRLLPRINLTLVADYIDTDRRDFVSSLPEASAAVMLAFPDRYVRNAAGQLVSTDLRPVNFDSDREKRVRWGVNLRAKLGESAVPAGKPKSASARGRGTTLLFSANHTIVLSEEIVIRPGLDRVDILKGGAVGIGGGRVRQQADASLSVESNGLGARVKADWRGASKLVTRAAGLSDTLDFSLLFRLDAKVFADVSRIVDTGPWAKGLRLSVSAANLTNARQRVRDTAGETPLQYQRNLRDPIGRTIEFELRKIF